MMRRSFVGGLLAGVLVMSTVGLAGAQDEELRMGDDPAYYQRVEVPEAGIAISLPPGWDVDIEMDFNPRDNGSPGSGYWNVLSAYGDAEDWCQVIRHLQPDAELRGVAQLVVDSYDQGPDGESSAQGAEVDLPVGGAYRVDVHHLEPDDHSAVYLFDSDSARYNLTCHADERDPRDWLDIAESLEWLPAEGIIDPPPVNEPDPEPVDDPDPKPAVEPEPEPEPAETSTTSTPWQRVEVPEAGVAISLPPEWQVAAVTDDWVFWLPPEFGELATVPLTQFITAHPDDGGWCGTYRYDEIPLSLDEHAAWFEAMAGSDPDDPGRAEVVSVELPVGDALRVIQDYESSDDVAIYLFDVDGYRTQLVCESESIPDGAWLAVAKTIEPLAGEPVEEAPSSVPDDAVATDEVVDFGSTVPVDEAHVMSAWCERATWTEYADGSFVEHTECVLTDDPVEPSEDQGSPPAEAMTVLRGGPCEWVSDFWIVYDGSEVWADDWAVTIGSDGSVLGTATYGPDVLDCASED